MWNRPVESVFLYISNNYVSTGNIAAFDLDWTLCRTFKGLWPKDPSDIKLMAGRLDKLKQLNKDGWSIVIFTNQKSTTENKINFNFARVNNFIGMLGDIKVITIMSIGDDEYRKPNVGMYQLLQQVVPDIKQSFYCGDAAGRPGDFSDSDRMFAQNAGMTFYTPEQIFPRPIINWDNNNDKTMVLFVGMPGVGKTTYYNTNLEPLGYHHVNQDALKTKAKCLRVTRDLTKSGHNITIDCTNPGLDRRREFYIYAQQNGYNIVTIYFSGDGRGWNKLRPKPVPTIGYSMYYKYLVEPTPENTPGVLYEI